MGRQSSIETSAKQVLKILWLGIFAPENVDLLALLALGTGARRRVTQFRSGAVHFRTIPW